MSETWVKRAITKSKSLFALLFVESNTYEELKPMHSIAHVFCNDLPLRLPPFRGIEHQIGLLPAAPLPNKPVFRCNPHESKELHR